MKTREIKLKQVDYKCERCGGHAKHIHHVDKNHKNNNLKNLLALCILCHAKAHSSVKILFECPNCDSSHNYRRISTGEQVCQKCGNVWKVKEK